MLETWALETLQGGKFSTQLIKPDYLVIAQPTPRNNFFGNLLLIYTSMTWSVYYISRGISEQVKSISL